MNDRQEKVVIVPCSGIGKTYGSVSREAAYKVAEDMRPADTQLVALSLLVLGSLYINRSDKDFAYTLLSGARNILADSASTSSSLISAVEKLLEETEQ